MSGKYKLTQELIRFVKEYYNEQVKVDPRVLADKLSVHPGWLINQMNDLGIRNKRAHRHDN